MTALEIIAVLVFFAPAYAADVSPILARELFPRLSRAVDLGARFRGQPIFGDHKTWRGVVSAVVVGVVTYEIQRALDGFAIVGALALIDRAVWPIVPGLLMGLGAGLGDLVKSFFKRRLGIPPGASWIPFDQLDFFLGAWLLVSLVARPPFAATLASLPIVFVGDVAACWLFWRVGLKERRI